MFFITIVSVKCFIYIIKLIHICFGGCWELCYKEYSLHYSKFNSICISSSEYFRECKSELFPRFCFCQFFYGSEKLLTKNCTVKKPLNNNCIIGNVSSSPILVKITISIYCITISFNCYLEVSLC